MAMSEETKEYGITYMAGVMALAMVLMFFKNCHDGESFDYRYRIDARERACQAAIAAKDPAAVEKMCAY